MEMTRYVPNEGKYDFDVSTQPDDEDQLEGLSATFDSNEPPILLGYIKWCAVSGFYWGWGSHRRFWELVAMCDELTSDGLRLLHEHAPHEARFWEARHLRSVAAPIEWVESEVEAVFESGDQAPAFPILWIVAISIAVLVAWYFLQGA